MNSNNTICDKYTNCEINMPKYNKKNWEKIYKENDYYKHNCYAYALEQFNDKSITNNKPQMGYYGYPYKIKPSSLKSCSDLSHRVIIDNPHIYKIYYNKKCKKGYYKTFLFLSPNSDYHWFRQDKNGMYSHKPGLTQITDKNTDSKKINNPLTACRSRYSNKNQIMDYSMACDSFCVPNKNTFVE